MPRYQLSALPKSHQNYHPHTSSGRLQFEDLKSFDDMTKSCTPKTHHEFSEKYIYLYSGSKPSLCLGGCFEFCFLFGGWFIFNLSKTTKALKSPPKKTGTSVGGKNQQATHYKNYNPNPTNLPSPGLQNWLG